MTTDDDEYYRKHYEAAPIGDRSYDSVRPAYHVGHIAARNPDYRGRSFDEVDADQVDRVLAGSVACRAVPLMMTALAATAAMAAAAVELVRG